MCAGDNAVKLRERSDFYILALKGAGSGLVSSATAAICIKYSVYLAPVPRINLTPIRDSFEVEG